MNVLHLLLGAAVAAAQPAADTVDPQAARGIQLDTEPAYCEETPTLADGAAPPPTQELIPVANADETAALERPPVEVTTYEELLARAQRNAALSRTGTGNLLWRPGSDPDEGLYRPLNVMVDGCMVPTLIRRSPQEFPPDPAPALVTQPRVKLDGQRLGNEAPGD